MLGAAFLALNACNASSGPSPTTPLATAAGPSGPLVGNRLQRPEPTPLPTLPAAVAIDYAGNPSVGRTYTSSAFGLPLTFELTPRSPGSDTIDVCPAPSTSSRFIVFAHPKVCHDELRFIRPWAVACGTIGDHPNADALAAAILAIPGTTNPRDLGDLQSSAALPAGMFGDEYHGRVVEILGSGPAFGANAVDPDHCRLLAEPASNDPVIEIRQDIGALFVLVDVDGELVVIRAGQEGYDAATGVEAHPPGTQTQPGDEQLRQLSHLLGLVTDIRFGPHPLPQDGSPPP